MVSVCTEKMVQEGSGKKTLNMEEKENKKKVVGEMLEIDDIVIFNYSVSRNAVLIDVRKSNEFEEKWLRGTVMNLPCKEARDLVNENERYQKKLKRKVAHSVVCFVSEGEEETSQVASLMLEYGAEKIVHYKYLQKLETKFPCLFYGKNVKHDIDLVESLNYPNQILENLFLGAISHAHTRSSLDDLNIMNVVNMTSEYGNKFENTLNYLRVKIEDDETVYISEYFRETSEFIHQCVQKGESVLVHWFALD